MVVGGGISGCRGDRKRGVVGVAVRAWGFWAEAEAEAAGIRGHLFPANWRMVVVERYDDGDVGMVVLADLIFCSAGWGEGDWSVRVGGWSRRRLGPWDRWPHSLGPK